MEKKENNIVVIILIVINIILLVLCLLFATGTINFNNNSNNNDIENGDIIINSNIEEDTEDTFSLDKMAGTVEVKGYSEVKKLVLTDEVNDNPAEEVTYVYFHIVNSSSNNFQKYISEMNGNSFVLDDGVVLGCLKDDKIMYYNDSDVTGEKVYEISTEDSNSILSSSETNQVTLKLEKYELSGGKEALSCYSHISTVQVIK